MNDHDQIEELLAAQALGRLDDADERALTEAQVAHGPACAECARLEREFGEVAASLAMELEPVPLRDGFEDQVMAAVRADARTAAPPTPAAAADRDVVALPPAERRWQRRLGAVAVAAALLLGGFALGRLTQSTDAPSAEFLAQATILNLQGDAPGSISVAYRPGEPGGYLMGADVPAAEGDAVYALWTISGETPTLVGCFTPDDGELSASFDQEVDQAELMAITVEPPSCPSAPTTPPIFAGEVVTA